MTKKLSILCAVICTLLSLAASGAKKQEARYVTHTVSAPFAMEPIKEYVFPEKRFPITKYGAKPGGEYSNTKAIDKAIKACNKAGGGTVVVPKGEWLTGPIHFMSNVNLHLDEGAVLVFSDNYMEYLPAVQTSWEGLECFNYSPLVYAFQCENIAITGTGKLQPRIKGWSPWFKRPKEHLEASKQLYTYGATDVPVEQRQMAVGKNNMRPHLIHFNRCRNILLDGFRINGSPFWTIHLFLCDGGIARNLNVYAHNHNNDGIDLEMTRNVLVENCSFDQGDDAIVIKSGRNRDAWRVNQPTENVVIRNCKVVKGHCFLGIGSEMSGGVRNIYMENCEATDSVFRMMYLKTNHRRGGFIHHVYMKNCKGTCAGRMFEIDTDVLYQWKDLVPTYETRITPIHDIYMEDCEMKRADAIYEIKGDARKPVHDIYLKNLKVGLVRKFINKSSNTFNVRTENVTYDKTGF